MGDVVLILINANINKGGVRQGQPIICTVVSFVCGN